MKRTVAERFSEKWTPEPYSGCWLWTAYCKPTGYGVTNWNQKYMRAHRLSWILNRGEIPDGLNVLHKCDTPCCVNPDHLFLGTPADNKHDSVSKNRTARGSNNGRSKLTENDVLEIRSLKQTGLSYVKLAHRFSVDKRTIFDAINRKNWKYLCQK